MEATPFGELEHGDSFGCGELVNEALNAWNIVIFDDFGHGMGCVVVSVNNTDYT